MIEHETFVTIHSKDHLASLIGTKIIDTWSSNFKGLDNLWEEYYKGDSSFKYESIDGKEVLVRQVHVARIYVYFTDKAGNRFQLYEAYQEYYTDQGQKRKRERNLKYIGGKIKNNQTPLEGAVAETNEELFGYTHQSGEVMRISGDRLVFSEELQEEPQDSKSFPGLLSRYTTYSYNLELTQAEYKDEYVEVNGTKRNVYSWMPVE